MLAKLVLMSVVIGMVAIPVLTASDPSPQRGLKKALVIVLVFNLVYLFTIRFIYPHLL